MTPLSLLHIAMHQEPLCLPGQKRLPQLGRLHQVYCMLEHIQPFVWQRNKACYSQEDLTKLVTCQDIQGTPICRKQKQNYRQAF